MKFERTNTILRLHVLRKSPISPISCCANVGPIRVFPLLHDGRSRDLSHTHRDAYSSSSCDLVARLDEVVGKLLNNVGRVARLNSLRVVCDEDGLVGLDDDDALSTLRYSLSSCPLRPSPDIHGLRWKSSPKGPHVWPAFDVPFFRTDSGHRP